MVSWLICGHASLSRYFLIQKINDEKKKKNFFQTKQFYFGQSIKFGFLRKAQAKVQLGSIAPVLNAGED